MTKRASCVWSCRHCQSRPRGRLKPLLARWQKKHVTPMKALDLVTQEIIKLCKGKDLGQDGVGVHFTKEKLSMTLGLREHIVGQALHKLNLKGIVSQPTHRVPHDSSRDPWTGGKGDSAWQADIYRVLKIPEEHKEKL